MSLSRPHAFWTKTDRIYKREFSVPSGEKKIIVNLLNATTNILNRHEKKKENFPEILEAPNTEFKEIQTDT